MFFEGGVSKWGVGGWNGVDKKCTLDRAPAG